MNILKRFGNFIFVLCDAKVSELTWLCIGLAFFLEGASYYHDLAVYGTNLITLVDYAIFAGIGIFYLFFVMEFITYWVQQDDPLTNAPPVNEKTDDVMPEDTTSIPKGGNIDLLQKVVIEMYNDLDCTETEAMGSLAFLAGNALHNYGHKSIAVKTDKVKIEILITPNSASEGEQ